MTSRCRRDGPGTTPTHGRRTITSTRRRASRCGSTLGRRAATARGDSPTGSVAADSASVEADMGGGSWDTDGGLVKKAKTKASVDFSAVKEASAAKKAASMPPVDKNEDTPEMAVARDREVKKLIERIRQTCARSVTLSKEPGNALTRFFFLSQIDSPKQGALAPENGGRAEYGGKDLAMHDVLIPFNAGKDMCLHRELLKAGLEPGNL